MKREMFLVLVVAVALLSPSAHALATGSILDIVLSNQNPYPVSPGETVTIEIQIQNTGYGEASNRVIEIMPKPPFTLLPGEDKTDIITRIPGRGSHSLTYRLNVNNSVTTNTYPLEFRIYSGVVRDIYVTDTVQINVEGDPNLVIEDLYTSPDVLEPGANAEVIVKLKNIGTGTANELQLSLNSSHSEIRPILAKGKVYVGDIKPGESKTVNLGISIDSSAEEKTYSVSLSASYKNDDNSDSLDSFSVGLPVRGTINLDVIKKEANYERGTLRIEVANKGTTEAKSLEAKLVIGGETVGIDYVSSLKANKKTTLEFPLVYEGSGSLELKYIGPGIEKNEESKEIVLSYEKQGNGGGTTMLLAVIVLAVIAYFLYMKFFRKKHKA